MAQDRRRARRRTTVVAAGVVVASVAWVLTGPGLGGDGAAATAPPAAAPVGPAAAPVGTAVLAFAGDVHFAGASARALQEGLGSAGELLGDADLSVLNLETAVTDGGSAAPKQYTFRAPDRAFDVLAQAGVTAVSLANNHGMDYGREGLRDTLAAAEAAGVPVLGAGEDEDAAYAPLRREVNGLRVSVLAATDVLDSFATDAWVAGPERAGMASSKDPERLLAAVREEAGQADVVVAYVHWGRELESCPTERQRELARLLARAGADLVVGSHAHVLQPAETVEGTYVAYGLGNFVFYARKEATTRSGVLVVEVGADGVVGTRWHPATISDGLPELDGEPASGPQPPVRCG